jgi:hypothetical protein
MEGEVRVNPFIRHMLLCDDARRRPGEPGKIDVYGLLNTVRAEGAAFPVHLTFCVYLAMTGGRGTGKGRIVVTEADGETRVYEGTVHEITFDPDPLKVLGAIFRIPSCPFPRAGLFWVEFRYNDTMLARQPLLVRGEK